MRRLFDGIARRLARILVRIFFRAVEVTGLERVPSAGPIVFVANHGNSLIDPFVLVAVLPRYPRFLAKSTLWSNPAVRPLLELGGVVPVYRQQDQVDTSRNRETFARCHDELARGGAVALFPEGISHDEPALQPMRTGAARIALEAERGRGPLGVGIVPVGLTFDAKALFRSRALVNVGAPIDLAPELARHDADPTGAVRALTERIRE